MPEKLSALAKLRAHFGDEVLVVGSCAAPYSSAGLLYGLDEAMVMLLTDPQLLADTCDFFVQLQSHYVEAQIEAGAHAIWIGDCNAFSGMLSVEQYRQFALPWCRQLGAHIRKCGAIAYLHNSEVLVPYLLAESEASVDIINCGPAADMATVSQALGGRHCFSGNLDPIEVLMRGTPARVAEEAARIVTICDAYGGYVFNTGEMNPRDVPVENMKAMIAAVRETDRKRGC